MVWLRKTRDLIYKIRTLALGHFLRLCAARYFVIYKLEMDIGRSQPLSEIRDYISRYNSWIYSRAVARFLKRLFEYSIEQQQKKTNLSENTKPLFILHVCVWGEEYTDKMLKFLLPSLLAEGNVPSVASDHAVLLKVTCDQKTCDKLTSAPVTKKLMQYCSVDFDIVPTDIFDKMSRAQADWVSRILSRVSNVRPNWKYYLLGCLQNLAMQEAQCLNSHISFLMPDFIFSQDAFSKLFNKVDLGYKVAVATSFRTLDTNVTDSVAEYYQDGVLDVPASKLATIAVDCMHSAAQHRIVSNKNRNFQLTAQLIFHNSQEIVVRALHYHPLLVNFSKIKSKVSFDYNPIDSNFLCNIVDFDADLTSQVWVVEDPANITMMEVSSFDIEPALQLSKEQDVSKMVTKFLESPTWNNLNRYLFSKRCVYSYQGSTHYIMSDICDKKFSK